MKLKDYQEEASRTDAPLGRNYDKLHAVHMVMGMSTEVGELVDVFKKNLAYKKPIDWVNVKEEIGDLMWYIVNFCNENNLDINSILETNINKLKDRYPEKFSTDDAINRNLVKERNTLEK
jgi:NTP pyrophosphatase (non-canonical NTP hydrolase)